MGWNKHKAYNIPYACALSVLRGRLIARSGSLCSHMSESLRIIKNNATVKVVATNSINPRQCTMSVIRKNKINNE
jgi:hypothetical protein